MSEQAFLVAAIALAAVGLHTQSGGLPENLTGKTAEPVDPALAFRAKALTTGSQQVTLDFFIRPGYYLYRERISVALENAAAWRIMNTAFPPTIAAVVRWSLRSLTLAMDATGIICACILFRVIGLRSSR